MLVSFPPFFILVSQRVFVLVKNSAWTFEAKDHIHTYLYPNQMGKWLSSFPLINSNYLMVKISHWMYLILFPLNVVWGGGSCHMSSNFLSLSLLWGAGKNGLSYLALWIIYCSFFPLEKNKLLTCEFFFFQTRTASMSDLYFLCYFSLCQMFLMKTIGNMTQRGYHIPFV